MTEQSDMKVRMDSHWLRRWMAMLCAGCVFVTALAVSAQETPKKSDDSPKQQTPAQPTERKESRVPS
jgi:hypothetical protein